MTSAKGKAKEDAHWQLGWWELSPILDRTHKPVTWSRSSVILSAHATKPHVLAHHHNSSKEFTLNTPLAINNDLDSYRPPTIISVSPKEDYVFAYFPGIKDSIGCVWRRGIQLDAWTIQDEWRYPHGAGIVACEWSSSVRDWTVNELGTASRLPPLGLQLPISDPILLLITRSREFHVILFPPALQLRSKVLKLPLMGATTINVPRQELYPETLIDNSVGGRRVCVAASIGLSYNDGSILVATRSHLLPPDEFGGASDDAMDMVLNLGQSMSNPLSTAQTNSWDSWGEEPIIEVSEVFLNLPGLPIVLYSRPLPPILRPGGHLIDMRFFCTPPEPPGSTSPMATKDPRRQAKEQAEKRGHLYLVANFLNTGDYTAPPHSEVNVYTFGRTSVTPPKWSFQKELSKSFDKAVVAYMLPVPTRTGVFFGLLDTSGSYRRTEPQPRAVNVGHVSVLNLPDLSTDDRWETLPILSPPDSVGRDLPTSYALSPNSLLLVTSPSESRTTISNLPRRKSLLPPIQGSNISMELGRSLAASVFARKSSVDVIDIVTARSSPEGLQESTLTLAITIIENNAAGLGGMWMHEFLGVLAEVARTKLERATEPTERAVLKAQWTTIHDMCSIAVINTAFADCRDDDSYDLEAVWQLIALCVWVLDFLERIMRDCVSIGDNLAATKGNSSISVSKTEPASANLLHLVHRYALNNLHVVVNHVKGLRDELNNLAPKAENAHMAKEVLMDAFNCAGINIDALSKVLGELKDSSTVTGITTLDLRHCLANFAPIPSIQPNVMEILGKLLTSKAVDRPKLFIKSPDLIDDLSQMSLSDQRKEKEKVGDVVTKGTLLRRGAIFTCIRCNGKFEMGDNSVGGHASLRWRAWERRWAYGCICGGLWTFSGNL